MHGLWLASVAFALALPACGDTSRDDGEAAAGSGSGSGGAGGSPPADCTNPFGSGAAGACESAALAALMGAAKELDASSAKAIDELGIACRDLALALGAGAGDVSATDPVEIATSWCDVAADRVASALGASGAATLSLQPRHCEIDAPAQAACELGCLGGKPECAAVLENIAARCPAAAASATCSGACLGGCEASDTEPSTCNGQCAGACTGTCDGADMTDGACDGTCQGACAGACSLQPPAAVCPGGCMGACDNRVTAVACTDELAAPSGDCAGCADCSDACAAVGLVTSVCVVPGVGVTAPAVAADAVAALVAGFPSILQLQHRCEVLVAAVTRLADVANALTGPAGSSPGAAQCIVDAANQLSDAAVRVQACVQGSVSALASVGG